MTDRPYATHEEQMIGTALVTGAASGIGAAVISRLSARGTQVVGIDQRYPDGVDRQKRHVHYVRADLRNAEEVRSAVTQARDLLGRSPDAVIQSAGIYEAAPLVECAESTWDGMFAVNVRAAFLVAQAVMRDRSMSDAPLSFVNVASTAAIRGFRSEPAAAYNASKAALLALTRQMAIEWADQSVRANAVLPGFTDTPMVRVMDDPESGQATLDHVVPLRRMGTPDEIAATICFLASPLSSYTTGSTVTVDGGLLENLD